MIRWLDGVFEMLPKEEMTLSECKQYLADRHKPRTTLHIVVGEGDDDEIEKKKNETTLSKKSNKNDEKYGIFFAFYTPSYTREWVPVDRLDNHHICKHPEAVPFLRAHPDRIRALSLVQNPSEGAMQLLFECIDAEEKVPNEFRTDFSKNPAALPHLETHPGWLCVHGLVQQSTRHPFLESYLLQHIDELTLTDWQTWVTQPSIFCYLSRKMENIPFPAIPFLGCNHSKKAVSYLRHVWKQLNSELQFEVADHSLTNPFAWEWLCELVVDRHTCDAIHKNLRVGMAFNPRATLNVIQSCIEISFFCRKIRWDDRWRVLSQVNPRMFDELMQSRPDGESYDFLQSKADRFLAGEMEEDELEWEVCKFMKDPRLVTRLSEYFHFSTHPALKTWKRDMNDYVHWVDTLLDEFPEAIDPARLCGTVHPRVVEYLATVPTEKIDPFLLSLQPGIFYADSDNETR